MLARAVVVCTLVVLAHMELCCAIQPTPEIQTSNLPTGICPSAGNYLLPDITDSTSYYVCCGNETTTVRKTCRQDLLSFMHTLVFRWFNKQSFHLIYFQDSSKCQTLSAVVFCRYNAVGGDQYDVFTPAMYKSDAGECGR